MTSPPRPSAATRILDAVFGERLTGVEAERARAARPPGWVTWVFNGLLAAWLCLVAVWGFRALGWLPTAFGDFEWLSGIWIGLLGWALTFSREAVSKHYRRRAERQMKPSTIASPR